MKKKDILIILTLLFLVVTAWISSEIYHSFVESTISETVNQEIAPINPTFDKGTIDMLKQREKINPSFELENKISTPTSQETAASQGGTITP